MRHHHRSLLAFVLCGLLARPAAAATEAEEAAQAAFDEALKLMRAKRYAEACGHLARSQDLDPAMGTQFRLAECYEKLGRNASAYDQYMAVVEAAKAEKQIQRESVARTRATALEPKIARLTLDIAPSVATLRGIEIRRDGLVIDKALWRKPITIDTGDHVVTVHASGKVPFERKFLADATSKLVISVAALDDQNVPPPPSRSKVPVFVLGGLGVVGVGLGITFVALRAGQITDAEAISAKIVAGGGNCRPGGPASFAILCNDVLAAAKKGDTFGTLSVLSFSVGGAALIGMGTYLLWPAPKAPDEQAKSLRILPVFTTNTVGIAATGAF